MKIRYILILVLRDSKKMRFQRDKQYEVLEVRT